MRVELDTKAFIQELNNITQYSIGFLDGAEKGKEVFLDNFGKTIVESLKNFIDSNARVSPQTLHHIYEWYQEGSPQARLFDIDYIVTGKNNISFNYTFSQSKSVSNGSTTPFYDKANIMEKGLPVVIKPKLNGVLTFNDNGEQVFTKKSIVVENPGGSGVQGSFESTLKDFFDNYFTQSFIISSGIMEHFKNVETYKHNLRSGAKQGKSLGFKIGYEWMSKGGKIE